MRKFHKLISTALAVAMAVSLLAGCGNADSASGAGDNSQENAAAEADTGNEADAGAADVDDATKPTLDTVTETVQTELAAALDTPVESMTIAMTSASFDTAPFSPPHARSWAHHLYALGKDVLSDQCSCNLRQRRHAALDWEGSNQG